MDLYNTSEDRLSALTAFVSTLTFSERKALITLARSQSVPTIDQSPILFHKTRPILDRLVRHPPFSSLADELLPVASLIVDLLASPLTTGILIVYSLGVDLSDVEIERGREESYIKELLATQTVRREVNWHWEAIFNPHSNKGSVVHPLFPFLSPLQKQFSLGVSRLSRSYHSRILLPHYSSRGVSSETAELLQQRVVKGSKGAWGNRSTFHRTLKRNNVTSKDIIHHYVRTGDWIFGRTEMKQRWYPSGLLPRTYFAWGGVSIAVSSYLRNFFNDLGDSFEPTHRKNRVQQNWLHSDHPNHSGFLFYDLTSFTSWFHEQVSFLTSLARQFSGVRVFLVGENLSLSEHDLGSLIQGYVDYANNYPEFIVSAKLAPGPDTLSLVHQCAGFLGIPGNLITCTVAHGLAMSSTYSLPNEIQIPGDDVGCSFRSDDHMRDLITGASTLGQLQWEKVFRFPQICIYLKRLVVDLGRSIELAPMLIFPLLPYLINPNDSRKRSGQFRYPDSDKLLPRAAHVLVAFQRDLWNLTHGNIDSLSAEIILLLIRTIHTQVGLPFGAIFQGRLYGVDDPNDDRRFPQISVKFPCDEDHTLLVNPDVHFANKYVTQMIIRSIVGVEIRTIEDDVREGETFVVKNSKSWRFLEDMGYIKILGIPGEKLTLVGEDARDAYLFSSEPPFCEVEVLSDLDMSQMVAAGVAQSPSSIGFEQKMAPSSTGFDVNMQSWRYRKYVDYDDPRSFGLPTRVRESVLEGLSVLRSSLSPEPPDVYLDY